MPQESRDSNVNTFGKLSRRDFLKLGVGSGAAVLGAAVFGAKLFSVPGFNDGLLAASSVETPVIWLQSGGCTGCSESLLNTVNPYINNVIVDEVIPGNHVSLRFHPTVMAAAGEMAMKAMYDTAKNKGAFVLIAEGAFSTKDGGIYCEVGEENGKGITALEHLIHLGDNAMAVIAVGTCATYGGIPAAEPNPTGCKGVQDVLSSEGIATPVINIAGCPAHPDWIVGTIASILIGGLESVELDREGRPTAFYSKLIHDMCPRRQYYDVGKFATKPSEPYCLYALGCKGPVTHADCPVRRWNNGVNWCIGCNHPCIGCTEPDFPDKKSPFFQKAASTGVAAANEIVEDVGLAVGIATAAGLATHLGMTAASGRLKKKQSEGGQS
jgi:hydrogenase small subunit